MKIEFLKERAKEFFEEAEELLRKKKYNLSAFNIEQAIQLWIKYLIGKKIGDWPKTHYFSELIPQLSIAYENEKIMNFYKKNELFFNNLEDAYFTTRYFPKKFTENAILMFIQKCKEFFEIIKQEINEEF